MPDTHALRLTARALAFSIALSSAAAAQPPTIDDAVTMYLGARYEDALALLNGLHGPTIAEQNRIGLYRLSCLVALGRTAEADRTIEAMVSADPFYQPPEELASPRIRELYRAGRRRVLPEITRRDYASAKLAFDRKDPGAAAMFERVLKLVGDPDAEASPESGDLRVLAEGFRDLSRSFAAPAAGATAGAGAAAPPAASTRPPAQAPAANGAATAIDPLAQRPAREGDPGIVPPVTLSQPMPRWVPPAGVSGVLEFDGVIELVIDARGMVTSATLRDSVHPQYDPQLLRTARSWKFKPATKDGKAVPYTKLVEVRLAPAAR